MVPPESRDSLAASSFCRSFIAAASLPIAAERSSPLMRGHGPSSNALRAARIAFSASAGLATGISATASPSNGLMLGCVLPPSASTNAPSI